LEKEKFYLRKYLPNDFSVGGFTSEISYEVEPRKPCKNLKVIIVIKSKNNKKMGIGWANKKRRDRKAKKRGIIKSKSKKR
jgi:hypothetical protein